MNEAFLEVDDRGRYQAFRHIGATHKQRVGPPFAKPSEAIAYAKRLDEGRDVSPLRSGEPPTASPAPPDGIGSGRTALLTAPTKAVNPASPLIRGQ